MFAVFSIEWVALIRDLLVALIGAQIGAPYSKIGLIRESKSIDRALKDFYLSRSKFRLVC